MKLTFLKSWGFDIGGYLLLPLGVPPNIVEIKFFDLNVPYPFSSSKLSPRNTILI